MITIKHTTHGLFLIGHGTAAMVACDDPAALAGAIRRIVASPMPKLYPDPPTPRPSWSRPLTMTAQRDAEDRRRVALSEAKAQLRDRLVRARARHLVEV